MRELLKKWYPEVEAGGFTRDDGTLQFYSRVQALLAPGQCVMDFGAGRGAALQDQTVPPFKRKLRDLRGDNRVVIGVDVDPAVRENTFLDQAYVVEPRETLPFTDAHFDIICSDFVFEHIGDPHHVCAELARVLKPGGWICARTANRFGYVALASSMIPNRMHHGILRNLQPFRASRDVFPTVYRLNSLQALKTHFPIEHFSHHVYHHEAEPSYFGAHPLLWNVGMFAKYVTPNALKNALMIFLQKKHALESDSSNGQRRGSRSAAAG